MPDTPPVPGQFWLNRVRFAPIPGFPGYFASEVVLHDRSIWRQIGTHLFGVHPWTYTASPLTLRVYLGKKCRTVDRLVWHAFHPDSKPPGRLYHNPDGSYTNCSVNNLSTHDRFRTCTLCRKRLPLTRANFPALRYLCKLCFYSSRRSYKHAYENAAYARLTPAQRKRLCRHRYLLAKRKARKAGLSVWQARKLSEARRTAQNPNPQKL